eukprot:m.287720 g.287720  ORF g.287720 m.287720 type:complete len:115 (-) comp16365_c1_seq4:39-383(-)
MANVSFFSGCVCLNSCYLYSAAKLLESVQVGRSVVRQEMNKLFTTFELHMDSFSLKSREKRLFVIAVLFAIGKSKNEIPLPEDALKIWSEMGDVAQEKVELLSTILCQPPDEFR